MEEEKMAEEMKKLQEMVLGLTVNMKEMESRLVARLDRQETRWLENQEAISATNNWVTTLHEGHVKQVKETEARMVAAVKEVEENLRSTEANLEEEQEEIWKVACRERPREAERKAEREVMKKALKVQEDKREAEAKILEKARRTVGFDPIYKADVDRMYLENCRFGKAKNEEEAKWMSVKEFMMCDMKLTREEVDEMEHVRVFTPRRENACTVYVEFKERKDVLAIYSRTRGMRRRSNITNHIPPEYYAQYTAMENKCYKWRKEKGVRTKVRIGEYGLEVWRNDGGGYMRVNKAELGQLPEVEVPKRGQIQEEEGRPELEVRPGHEDKDNEDKETSEMEVGTGDVEAAKV
jgi:hypothetical protein